MKKKVEVCDMQFALCTATEPSYCPLILYTVLLSYCIYSSHYLYIVNMMFWEWGQGNYILRNLFVQLLLKYGLALVDWVDRLDIFSEGNDSLA